MSETKSTYTAGRHTGTVTVSTDAWGWTAYRFQIASTMQDGSISTSAPSVSYDADGVEQAMRQEVDGLARGDASAIAADAFYAQVEQDESHVQVWDED